MSTTLPTGPRSPRLWIRPAILLLGGALAAVLLWLAEQPIVAVAALAFSLFMAYWTSPLRTGAHTPLAQAMERRGDDVAIILWAPGNPLSARMQAAIRTPRDNVVWVNVYRDARAAQLLEEHGGPAALPLVIVGEETKGAATVNDLLALQAAGERRRDERGERPDERGER